MVDEPLQDTTEYVLPLLETAFESWNDIMFNKASSGGATSTSLEPVHPEGRMTQDLDEDSETDNDNEDNLVYIMQEPSYDSSHSEPSSIFVRSLVPRR